MAKEASVRPSLVQTVKESAFYNKNRLEELLFEDYPYPTSREFIKALIDIHKGILQKLESLEQGISSSINGFENQVVQVQRYGLVLNSLHSLLQILEMGKREYVPQGIVILIENIMKFSESRSKFLLLPSYEYNYSYVELIAPLKNALKDILTDVEKSLAFAEKFAVFWFPLAHKDNAILNSLLAHEMGHFIAEEKRIVEKVLSKITVDQKKIEEIAKEWLQTKLSAEKKEIRIDDYFGLETMKAQVKKEVVKKVSDQMKELVADSIAFCLFGPAYMIALANFLVSQAEVNLEPKGYPSPRVRISFLIDQFEKAKYSELFVKQRESGERIRQSASQKFIEIIEGWKGIMKKPGAASSDKITDLAREIVDTVHEDLQKEVHNSIGNLEYTEAKFEQETFKLIDTISLFVPPAEMNMEQPADPISILNAGMLYELTLIEEMHTMLGDQGDERRLLTRHKLHELIMKAIESSQIEAIMEKTKRELSE